MQMTNEAVLEEVNSYIVIQAKRLMNSHVSPIDKQLNSLEVDELTQRARIKLWRRLEKDSIHHPYSYVKRIVYNEFIDMRRQQRYMLPLPADDQVEEYKMDYLADPAEEVSQHMQDTLLLQQVVRMVMDLPPRQQLAMICSLQDEVDDLPLLASAFHSYNIDIKTLHWPSEKAEKRLLLASLPVAKRKLASSILSQRITNDIQALNSYCR
jgi:RNA polymerase sigma factor (sigma-70 family)